MNFKLKSAYTPSGDQPTAIKTLTDGLEKGLKEQILLGVTGSGKTFTMANIIAEISERRGEAVPTLVFAHNKTLAGQLCGEFREFFPENAVEYFVSYYDYYQPEAYIPGKDVYIEKDSAINEEIDRLRHSATLALSERRDVIIVASVSCIYGIGPPEEYRENSVSLRPQMKVSLKSIQKQLVKIQYSRSDISLERGKFRVRGDVLEIFPVGSLENSVLRVEFFGDEIERISEFNALTGSVTRRLVHALVFPASHYVFNAEKIKPALDDIEKECHERVEWFTQNHKLIEAQRIAERVMFDLEMLREVGTCKGVENYSRPLSRREAGSTPICLLDHFPKDFLIFADESHVSIPQIRGMSGGDRGRKENLINYGFRLPSAYDNRPLFFDEWEKKVPQIIYVSATPGEYEKTRCPVIAEQIIRPTGLLDPVISVRPTEGQIEDLIGEINERIKVGEKIIAVTLTKKQAESLTDFLKGYGIRTKYMHADTETMERLKIIRGLRRNEFDVLVGINLMREGLDLPEVSLVAIFDADKAGFLRGETSLIQTIGRAARNANGLVIMYADCVTPAMEASIRETERRRNIQKAYNAEHNITPATIIKQVSDVIEISDTSKPKKGRGKKSSDSDELETPLQAAKLPAAEKKKLIELYKSKMKEAALSLDFENAAYYRDLIAELGG